jgi:hypothetical protein
MFFKFIVQHLLDIGFCYFYLVAFYRVFFIDFENNQSFFLLFVILCYIYFG